MQARIDELVQLTLSQIAQATDSSSSQMLYDLKVRVLGKTGELTNLLKGMKDVRAEDRAAIGKIVNDARASLESAFDQARQTIRVREVAAQMQQRALDITIDRPAHVLGTLHPLTIMRDNIVQYFAKHGYVVIDSPEIETEFYNFEALNVPADHPARDMQDTFYIGDNLLLRSHTSNGQVRTMLNQQPPIKVLSPGRVYRADEMDATHSPMFHQIEGLVVDNGVTMSDLKGTLQNFARYIFGANTRVRFRPSYFPFTEPSVEVDASCQCVASGKAANTACKLCKGTGWIEILGAGMVHNNVLHTCKIDSTVYSGFAFGMGLERITNIVYGVSDMRYLYENDVRFLRQFAL